MLEEELDFEAHFAADDSGVETVEASAELGQIRRLLQVDAEFFVEFFLADQLDMPVPEFHKEIWSLLTGTAMERVLLAIPRDHAKTTLAKLCVIWYWLFTPHRFAVYLSNTSTIAKGAAKDIIGFLKNPNFVTVFGNVKVTKESETEGLWQFELDLGHGKVKNCILRAIGQGQQMRGINIDNQRPDIAVIDDVEDNENTESEFLQKKLDKWMFGPFLKALARRKKILWLGNMLQKTSLLARLSRNPRWNPVVFGSLIKDSVSGAMRPLWPEKWSVAALIEDFKEYRDLGLIETWMCEMMNMPGHGENGFTQDQINYRPIPTPDEIQAAWICVDPAFGKKVHNDNTAITVHALLEDGTPMVVSHINAQMSEVEIFENCMTLGMYWGAWVWGIEAVAAQKVLLTLFQFLLATRLMNHSVEILPLMSGSGDPKNGRISAWVALMAKNLYAIGDSDIEITGQLLQFDMRKKDQVDDLIDSCAYGPQMMERYLPLIMESFNGGAGASIPAQWGRRVAGV
jgi:hypothetical protein